MLNQISSPEAYRLFHAGSLCLARIESNGIKIDVDYLEKTTADIRNRIRGMEEKLRSDGVWKLWKKEFGDSANLGSRQQLAEVVFGKMKYECKSFTPTKRPKADEAAFEHVEIPFVKDYFRVEKLKKLNGTYLKGLQRELIDGLIHPVYNLHTVITMRNSVDSPNFTNIPVRDAEIGPIIRKCFIPRKGRVFIEIDFGALEFAGAAIFWRDPAMVEYAKDPTKDIHRDVAAKLFNCSVKQVNKKTRYLGKNGIVFPLLYGSYYVQCTKNIWEELDSLEIEHNGKSGSIKQWLKHKGITERGTCDHKLLPRQGTFEKHVQGVEEWFNKKFHVWSQSKEQWYNEYRKTGGFRLATGFWLEGLFTKNFLLNAPIQGPMSHCLLWSLIEIGKELQKRKMKTLTVGAIHDCGLFDVPLNEVNGLVALAERIMTKDILAAWKWLIVPLKVEVEIAEPTWHHKRKWEKVAQNGL